MMTIMTGCGSDEDKSNHETYVIVGVHANQAIINTTEFEESLVDACKISENSIHLIAVDGDAYEAKVYQIPKAGFLLLPSQKKAAAEDYKDQIMRDIKTLKPRAEEVSYAKAFEDIGNNTQGGTTCDIIGYGSLLDTTGSVDYTKNLITLDSESFVKLLEKYELLPDLNHIRSVTLYGVGRCDGKTQEEMTNSQFKRFKQQWVSYFKHAGVPESHIKLFAGTESEAASSDDLPDVTPVDFPDADPYDPQGPESSDNMINDSQLGGFIPDTAEFRNPQKAEELAASLAETMKTGTWVVCGFTAGDTDSEWTRTLSRKRAKGVCGLLTKKGVDANRLIALGGGTGLGTPYHVEGKGIGSEGQVNRITVISRADTENGKMLVQKYSQSE